MKFNTLVIHGGIFGDEQTGSVNVPIHQMNRGYRVIFVVPGKFSEEKQIIMRALGAEIIHTPTEHGLEGAFARVAQLKSELGNVFVADQFNNRANPEAHYRLTGPEIYQQLDGHVDFCGPYAIEGIGNDFIPANLDLGYVDRTIKVTDKDAFARVAQLARREGLVVGSSSGAAFHAALRLASDIGHGNIVVVFPDRGERYLSQGIYSKCFEYIPTVLRRWQGTLTSKAVVNLLFPNEYS